MQKTNSAPSVTGKTIRLRGRELRIAGLVGKRSVLLPYPPGVAALISSGFWDALQRVMELENTKGLICPIHPRLCDMTGSHPMPWGLNPLPTSSWGNMEVDWMRETLSLSEVVCRGLSHRKSTATVET